ncbi:winged helix-turn-helix transcriptional regulator [Candidatus Woesearchaeota archaeon]|nr:winged helix-turn-helix transcriptional regulator [Candidatus Woesearchaeota archaeon]
MREVSQTIAQHIEPKIFPKINEITLEGKSCIQVEFAGNNLPYYAYGRAYMRVGDEDRQISAKELERLILDKNRDKLRWDKEICKKANINDISIERLTWFLEQAGKNYHSIEGSLDKLGLLRNGKLLNAAVILFGKKPQEFFPNAKLRCATFATITTSLIVDRQEFEGNLFYLIEKAEEYILKNIHIGMRLEGLRRIDVPEIDRDAFREAIINAFCHRNYYEYDSVNIAVFKDRVEIRSPGSLYGGLTINEIKVKMVSRRRNEVLAEMFHEVHFVERWGRGISLILEKEPTADFDVVAEIFTTSFKRKGADKGGLVERLVEGLAETQKKILELATKNQRVSKREMAERIGISTTAIDKNIASLKKKGILKRIGGAKGGHWEIIGENQSPDDKIQLSRR